MNDRIDELSELYRRETATARPHSNPLCPDSRHLAALAAGEVWPWRRRRLSRHLAECAHCAHEYRAVLAARDGLRAALDIAGPASARGWLDALIPAGAAAGLAAVLVVALAPGPQSGPAPSSHTSAPASTPASVSDTLFASNFDNGHSPPAERETLFRSDFNDPSES